MKKKLVINGGSSPLVGREFIKYNTIGQEEIDAVVGVMKSGVLSKFLGCWDEDFYGGEKVREFENAWSKYFKVKNAVTVNSWTSGLTTAVGAIGIEPGDEIIVSPWTMCATATAILHWNAIPVFADIDPKTFCLDPNSIENNISEHTKAIIPVDIFGQSSDIERINKIANKYNIKVISDTAQAPGALVNDSFAGTLSDIGGFSLNYHKHIHTGEGGVLVTDNDELAEKMRLIRNHGEAAVDGMGRKNIVNIIGNNFRLGEIESAIGIEQLKKLDYFVSSRQNIAKKITEGLEGLEGLETPFVREGLTHVYYVYPMIINNEIIDIPKEKVVNALIAEGVPGLSGSYMILSELPMYQNKIAYGSKGFPWTIAKRNIDYNIDQFPVSKKLRDDTYLGMEMCLFDFTNEEVDLIIDAFHKVWQNLDELK